jgi:hypothetical protein
MLRDVLEELRCRYASVLLMFDSVECYIHEYSITVVLLYPLVQLVTVVSVIHGLPQPEKKGN